MASQSPDRTLLPDPNAETTTPVVVDDPGTNSAGSSSRVAAAVASTGGLESIASLRGGSGNAFNRSIQVLPVPTIPRHGRA
jgi:hypothetical protein